MPRIRCFMIDPTERVHRVLEVRTCRCESCVARDGEQVTCPARSNEPHVGTYDLGQLIEPLDENGESMGTPIHLDDESQPWPTKCDACGAEIPVQFRRRGLTGSRIWRNPATGEEYDSPYRAPAGAMYRAPWLRHYCASQDDDAPLCVMTPGGGWVIDSQASNCDQKDDQHQDRHHCWTRRGVPPDVDVAKEQYGPTCGAGAGSIQCGSYHGFLRNGWLED